MRSATFTYFGAQSATSNRAPRAHLNLQTKRAALRARDENFPAKRAYLLNFETKSSLSPSVFIFSKITEIFETKLYVLWAQTCRNLKSIKFANYLNHMPLRKRRIYFLHFQILKRNMFLSVGHLLYKGVNGFPVYSFHVLLKML